MTLKVNIVHMLRVFDHNLVGRKYHEKPVKTISLSVKKEIVLVLKLRFQKLNNVTKSVTNILECNPLIPVAIAKIPKGFC